MSPRSWLRGGLLFLAVTQFFPFAWAMLAPRSFYESFPFGDPGWVQLLPPYNEHLVRDVGGLGVALGIVLAGAAVIGRRDIARVALLGFVVYDVPHAVFHTLHLHGFSTADAIAQTALFVVQLLVVVALWVLAGRVPDERRTTRTAV